jgi:hypothetical protein
MKVFDGERVGGSILTGDGREHLSPLSNENKQVGAYINNVTGAGSLGLQENAPLVAWAAMTQPMHDCRPIVGGSA